MHGNIHHFDDIFIDKHATQEGEKICQCAIENGNDNTLGKEGIQDILSACAKPTQNANALLFTGNTYGNIVVKHEDGEQGKHHRRIQDEIYR